MKTRPKTFVQWLMFLSLTTIGLFSFLVMAGDENPQQPLTISEWLLVKFSAAIVFISVYLACRFCYNNGLFPEYIDRVASKEEQE